MVNFPIRFFDCDSHRPALLNLFIPSGASICPTVVFPPLRNSDHVVASVSTGFPSNYKGMSLFIAQLTTILVLVGMIFMTIWETSCEMIYFNSVLLLLVLNLVN